MNRHERYLGDSVYCCIDGDVLCLFTKNDDGSENTISLEPEVIDALNTYVDWINSITDEEIDEYNSAIRQLNDEKELQF
jgi:hypothetical protein